jgi:5' nucleotidase family
VKCGKLLSDDEVLSSPESCARRSLDHIDVWGFDLDYTLASYNTRLQELVYELAQDYLINILNYPSSFKERKYDPKFAVRGAVSFKQSAAPSVVFTPACSPGISYDIMHGLLVKMDYHDNVTPHCTFRGTRRLSNSEVKKVYHGMYVSRLYREQKMKALIDMFSMSEACIIANLIQNFVENHTEFSNAAVAEVL